MTDADKREFVAILQDVARVYGREVTQDLARLYWGALRDMALAEFRSTCAHAIRTCKFFPNPAELRRVSRERIHPQADLAKVQAPVEVPRLEAAKLTTGASEALRDYRRKRGWLNDDEKASGEAASVEAAEERDAIQDEREGRIAGAIQDFMRRAIEGDS